MSNEYYSDMMNLQSPPPKAKKQRRWRWVLLGILMVFVFVALGGFLGYQSGIQLRLARQKKDSAYAAANQFQLALEDQNKGNLEMAKKRLEYVLQLDPKFPKAADKLAEVLLAGANTQEPPDTIKILQVTPTPAYTATPDTRAAGDIFNYAQQLIGAKQWNDAVMTLDALRKVDKTYRTVDVDGMYYTALRNRGIAKINQGDLEEGLYDMAVCERFAALDNEAESYRTWARAYLNGASYWGLDWGEAVKQFAQIVAASPGLRDNSGMTASERYRYAMVQFANQLAAAEQYCGDSGAEYYYKEALAIKSEAAVVVEATKVGVLCHPPTEVPTQPAGPVITVAPPGETPVVPVITPGEAPTAAPPATIAPPPPA